MADCQQPKSWLQNACIFFVAKRLKVAKGTLVHLEEKATMLEYYIFI